MFFRYVFNQIIQHKGDIMMSFLGDVNQLKPISRVSKSRDYNFSFVFTKAPNGTDRRNLQVIFRKKIK